MKITVLGCGTSTGVPVIGCRCEVCSSTSPFNKRTRSSLLVAVNGRNILIDTSTDLRSQALANGLDRIDAVLFTHPHADHIHGIDDLRAFNLWQENRAIPCFGTADTIERVRILFEYIFRDDGRDGWKPNLATTVVESAFDLFGETVTPIDVLHGTASIFGYRIGPLAYVTDCSSMPGGSIKALRGVDLLILGALRHKPHPTHFSIGQAIEVSKAIGAKRTVFTHLSHNLDYERDNGDLPDGVELAYDGLSIEL